ncbi:bud site selection protein [Scheffersomyces xylosifermentans]|uniref:bud site selection protein n=1 Tax=Scheffersomyces xylosifermentans TaxID=1304137 RepID=UPI00315D6C16
MSKRHSMNSIESSVTRLLVSTKHLLESLTQWARQEADDKFVSDAYVKLGNNFRAATKAFTHSGVDISDLGDVPQALRIILEAALSEAPSQENLDRFLPNIRNIIVTLLSNLKLKQAKAEALSKSKHGIEGVPTISISGTNSPSVSASSSTLDIGDSIPTSVLKTDHEPGAHEPSERKIPTAVNDALTQLQKGDVLQRRASKRFSAYQYAKLTNHSALPRIASEYGGSKSAQHGIDDTTIEEEPDVSRVSEADNSSVDIFLKINNKTRKVNITLPVTFASVRLLFVEKFAYSPGTSSFPEIYIQDPGSGIAYELEDHLLGDVKAGSLLSLNEPDASTELIKGLESKLSVISKRLETMTDEIRNQIKKEVGAIEIPAPVINAPTQNGKDLQSTNTAKTRRELADIQYEIKSIRQIQRTSSENVKQMVNELVTISNSFQESSAESSKSSNRSYMESCHSKLSDESDMLLTKVDDLQDIMEALRKDVAQRGVRVSEKQLKSTQKEIQEAKNYLRRMTDYIDKEKLVWKKIWESELDKVCEEQQFFNLQGDLTSDLEEDIKKIEETYELIEQCSLEQSKHTSYKRNRVAAQMYIPEPGESLHNIKDAVLNEVAALKPNHESRVAAIEKAEKLRERERELMQLNKFQEELGDFVEDNKLKKSGGIEELERVRQLKDSENLKSSFGII